jgi:hypothetical protein
MSIARVDALRSLAYTSITNSYTAIGTPTAVNFRIFRIVNDTDGKLYISFDGTTNNFIMPAGSFVLYDLSTNGPLISQTDSLVIQIGTTFYAKYLTAPTTGSVYVEGIYQRGQV